VFQGRVLSVSVANVKKEEYKKMGKKRSDCSQIVRKAHTFKGEKYLNKRKGSAAKTALFFIILYVVKSPINRSLLVNNFKVFLNRLIHAQKSV